MTYTGGHRKQGGHQWMMECKVNQWKYHDEVVAPRDIVYILQLICLDQIPKILLGKINLVMDL